MVWLLLLRTRPLLGDLCRLLLPALEALDAAPGVHELLLARVEGVAGRADLDVELRLRRPGLELVATRAPDGREDVLGMNVSFHGLKPGYQRRFRGLRCLPRRRR